jgi:phage tail tape-measure protein
MNKYLVKIADQIQHTPLKTAVHESVAAVPADIAGGMAGAKLGSKFGPKGIAIGSLAGAALGGLATNYAVLKHQQLKQQKGKST